MNDTMQYAILFVGGGYLGWYGVDLYRWLKNKLNVPGVEK